MKPLIIALLLSSLPLSAAAADGPGCAAEDMQLLYYYFAPDVDANIKERPTRCHPGRKTLKLPDWLEKDRPGMLERKVWRDPEEGELSEAALWQSPVSILYEFTSRLQEFRSGIAGPNKTDTEAELGTMRWRFLMSVDRLERAGLRKSLRGRGDKAVSALNRAMEGFDKASAAMERADGKAFRAAAEEISSQCRALMSLMFAEPGESGIKHYSYTPRPRLLAGYRGVTLPVAGPQALFLKEGDRADMLVTFSAIMKNEVKEKVTATILQNVLIMRVHRPDSPDGTGAVQMLVNPMEAQYAALSLAQGAGIAIVRRASGDSEMHPMEIASFRKLFK